MKTYHLKAHLFGNRYTEWKPYQPSDRGWDSNPCLLFKPLFLKCVLLYFTSGALYEFEILGIKEGVLFIFYLKNDCVSSAILSI